MKIELNIRQLKAAQLLTTKDDTRPYIQGVYIDDQGDKIKIVATDGKAMIIFEKYMHYGRKPEHSFLIPSKFIEGIKLDKRYDNCELSYHPNGKVDIEYFNNTYTTLTNDIKYPDYELAFPEKQKDDVHLTPNVGFDPTYITLFHKANKILSNNRTIGIILTKVSERGPMIVTPNVSDISDIKYRACLMQYLG